MSKVSLLDRWQFTDRQPRHVDGPAGLEGVIDEGLNRPKTNQLALSVDYCYDQRWEQVANAAGAPESIQENRALIETILRSYLPKVDGK